jgi:UDP-N-acetylmuramate dehydrogenase
LVRKVITLSRRGIIKVRSPGDFSIGYRTVMGPPGEWFVAGYLELEKDLEGKAAAHMKEILAHRLATQPIELPNCGSVFKNPPGDFAARLIEKAGLKGLREGGAAVSYKHANFIVNEGGASARDIENLIQKVKEAVFAQHGIQLTPEVRIMGRE